MKRLISPALRQFGFVLAILLAAFVSRAEEALTKREWTVDGDKREALVHIPVSAKTNAAPVVFAFHGHGGTMRQAARSFGYEKVWPEAIVVYMQGLNTPGQLTDPEGKKPGWQKTVGDQNDRDLKFFDAVLASLKKDYKVDAKRVYSTGHSNGGAFTYLLWAERGEQFAAFAPSSAAGRALIELPLPIEAVKKTNAPPIAEKTAPSASRAFLAKPVLHVAGESDPLVKFAWQKLMIDALRKKNQCGEGKPWDADKRCTIYPSKAKAPVVTFTHPGGHKFHDDAPGLIVKFFKQHALP